MTTLHIEDFPDDLYDALVKRANECCTSIAGILTELVRRHIPTEFELAARHTYFEKLSKIHAQPVPEGVDFRSKEAELREDRSR
jgi:hypothetical protein